MAVFDDLAAFAAVVRAKSLRVQQHRLALHNPLSAKQSGHWNRDLI
jgi:hypothetical protein